MNWYHFSICFKIISLVRILMSPNERFRWDWSYVNVNFGIHINDFMQFDCIPNVNIAFLKMETAKASSTKEQRIWLIETMNASTWTVQTGGFLWNAVKSTGLCVAQMTWKLLALRYFVFGYSYGKCQHETWTISIH